MLLVYTNSGGTNAMITPYNRIAGRSLERLAALSDGIFAVAMTLLVLDLHAPASDLIHSEGQLWRALAAMSPQLITYLMSFLTLGIFWHGQQAQLESFASSDRHLSWIQIAFLFAVSIMPFSTDCWPSLLPIAARLFATGATCSFWEPCSISVGNMRKEQAS